MLPPRLNNNQPIQLFFITHALQIFIVLAFSSPPPFHFLGLVAYPLPYTNEAYIKYIGTHNIYYINKITFAYVSYYTYLSYFV
jgi:hypothetical protein